MQQIENTHSSLPGIVVVGLLLDYLTRYYHHKKSLTTNTDEQIGKFLTILHVFRFYADPFDVDFSTLIECSLCQRNLNSSTSSNSTNTSLSSRPFGINNNCYDPRIYSRSATTGLSIIPYDPHTLYSSTNIQYALSKLLPNSLSSSNVYLKSIAGLFEITLLNYTMHSSSDGTHLERVDMTHLLT
ncbi:unnamed protein product [Rotaria sp. Silwood1]|nr:unnamed protein product [Rotaria sp. Silwood1]